MKQIKYIFTKEKVVKLGESSFFCGILFLPISPPISFSFLIFSLFASLIINKINFKKDNWNITLLISSSLIFVSTINTIYFNPSLISNRNTTIILATSFRWILMFISFNSFQFYLKKNTQRILFAKTFLLGSIPIIISCIAQYWFKVYGPINLFNGIFIWFNKPFISLDQGVSGLFSNQNYTGIWLAVLWPFCIYYLRKYRSFKTKKYLILFFTILNLYFLIMTISRSAILGVLISLPLIISIKLLIKIITFIAIILCFFYFTFPLNIFDQINILMPNSLKLLISKISDLNLYNWNNLPRITIWKNTIKFINIKPLLGYGAGSFPILFMGLGLLIRADHTHNIILQIAFDFGLPLAILLSLFISLLLFNSYKKLYYKNKFNNKNINIEKCWFASTLIVLVAQIYDITYFDGRVGLLIWILLAGLKCIIEDETYNNDTCN